ncbi:MAG: hypothetical protein HUJ60_02405 [Bacilli bacterium]|nr:hypothetical protein [Bacilli bacterium]
MNSPLILDSMAWLTPVIIVAVFGLIVLIVIIVKKKVKFFQSDEKPKSDKEVASEELNRLLQDVDDPEAQKQFQDYDKTGK